MAKWGEGDPRWIVEERPDATNVNNWHWTEKNADAWSKAKLKELLENLVIEDPKVGNVVVEKLDKVEGEARVNNRKAKLIFFYEWELKMSWKGHVNGDETQVEGTLEVPNLSEEHEDIEDVDVDVTVKKTAGSQGHILKELMRKGQGAKVIRKTLQAYVDALRTEFCQGLILPAKESKAGAKAGTSVTKVTSSSTVINKSNTAQMKSLDLGGTKIPVTKLELKEHFKCTGQELYNTLTQKEMLQVFTGGDVKMADQAAKDVDFEMIGGSVQGTFLQLEPFTKIVQKWRLKSWPGGHYSRVEIGIQQGKEDTTLSLSCSDVPEKELENTKAGWRRYYFESIKRVFGFGSNLC